LPNRYPVPHLKLKSESPIDDSVHKSAAFDLGCGSFLAILASPPDSLSHDPLDSHVHLVRFPSSSSLLAVQRSDSSEFETTPEPLLHSRIDQSEPLEEDSEGDNDIAAAIESRSPPRSLKLFPPQHTQSRLVSSAPLQGNSRSSSASPPSFISFSTRASSLSSSILFYFHALLPLFLILLHYVLLTFNAPSPSMSLGSFFPHVIPTYFVSSSTSLFPYSLPLSSAY